MRWQDIGADGVWTLPTAPREKNNPGTVPLPRIALDVIEAQPKIAGSQYVFSGRTKGPFAGFSPLKRKLVDRITAKLREDEPAAEPLPQWQLHDLRRTGKTLMARAGVRPDISERVLGHVIPGAEGVYDVHHYDPEKMDALNRLAALVERILNPPQDNVTTLTAARE
jgi:integrase